MIAGWCAFWPLPSGRWRPIVGLRWVRHGDPDGTAASHHPVRPYQVVVSETRHPLCTQLADMDLPRDEVYMKLEQTCPVMVLMETTTDEGTFPQCHINQTPWGGTMIGFLPGHRKQVIRSKSVLDNCRVLINYLLDPSRSTQA